MAARVKQLVLDKRPRYDLKQCQSYDAWQAARRGPGVHTMEMRSPPLGYEIYKAEKTLRGGIAPENRGLVDSMIAARKAWYEQQATNNPAPVPPVDTRSDDSNVTVLLTAIGDALNAGSVSDQTVRDAQGILAAFVSDTVSENEATAALQAISDIQRAIRPHAQGPTKQGLILVQLQAVLQRCYGAAALSIRLQSEPRNSRVAILRDSLRLPRAERPTAGITVAPRVRVDVVNQQPRAGADPFVAEPRTREFVVQDPVQNYQERQRLKDLANVKTALDEAARRGKRADGASQRVADRRADSVGAWRRAATAGTRDEDMLPQDQQVPQQDQPQAAPQDQPQQDQPQQDQPQDQQAPQDQPPQDQPPQDDIDEERPSAADQAQASATAAFEAAQAAEVRDEHSGAHAEAAKLAAEAARLAAARSVAERQPEAAQAAAQRLATGAARAAFAAQRAAQEAAMEQEVAQQGVPEGQEASTAAAIEVVDDIAEELHNESAFERIIRMAAERVQDREHVAAGVRATSNAFPRAEPAADSRVESRDGAPIDREAAVARAVRAALFRGVPEAEQARAAEDARGAAAAIAMAAVEARAQHGARSKLWAEASKQQEAAILEEADEAGRVAARQAAEREASARLAAGLPTQRLAADDLTNAVHAAVEQAFHERTDEPPEAEAPEDDDAPRRRKKPTASRLAQKGDHGARKLMPSRAETAKELRALALEAATRAREDGALPQAAALEAVQAVQPAAEAAGVPIAEVAAAVHVAAPQADARAEASHARSAERARKRAIDQVEIPKVQIREEAHEPAAKRWREAREEREAAASAEPAVALQHVEPPANAFQDAPAAKASKPKASRKKAPEVPQPHAAAAAAAAAKNPFEAAPAAAFKKAPKLAKKSAKPASSDEKKAAEGRWTRARSKKEADRVAAVAEARAPTLPAAPLLLDPAHVAVGGLTTRAELHSALEDGHLDEILAAMDAGGKAYKPRKNSTMKHIESSIAKRLGLGK